MGYNIRWEKTDKELELSYDFNRTGKVSKKHTAQSQQWSQCMMGLEVSWLLSLWFTAPPPNFLQETWLTFINRNIIYIH